MTEQYKDFVDTVLRRTNTNHNLLRSADNLLDLLKNAGVEYKRVEHELPEVVSDWSKAVEFSIEFVLIDEKSHKHRIVASYDWDNNLCQLLSGKVKK